MKMVLQLISKFFGIFYGIVAIFKKLLCFLNIKRGRRNSGSLLPLHSEGTGNLANTMVQQSLPSNDHTDMELESWDSWGANDQDSEFNSLGNNKHTVSNNFHPNAQNRSGFHGNRNSSTDAEEEQEIDYFQDMIPKVKKQPKIIVRKKEEYSQRSDGFSKRLTLNSEVPLTDDPNLGTWDDSENAWGDELSEDLSWEAKSAIKERKKIEREQRQADQLRKKQERERLRMPKGGNLTAVKLS